MSIKTEEISSLIKKQLANYQDKVSVEETGTVTYAGDGVARADGLVTGSTEWLKTSKVMM